MVDYKWHKHQLEAKKREIREKAELKSKKAHFKRKKAEYEAKYGISFENDEKRPKINELRVSKRNFDKFRTFSKNYAPGDPVSLYHHGDRVYETNPCAKVKLDEIKPPLQVGDRVILTYKYIAGNSYPVWGSKFECIGTIIEVGDNRTRVDWDNGRTYQYPMSALDHAPMGSTRLATSKAILDYCGTTAVIDPNTAFRIYKQGSMDRLKCKSMLDWHENVDRAAELIDR